MNGRAKMWKKFPFIVQDMVSFCLYFYQLLGSNIQIKNVKLTQVKWDCEWRFYSHQKPVPQYLHIALKAVATLRIGNILVYIL
jgi:hypothetical protein